jgi:hypothetical protein
MLKLHIQFWSALKTISALPVSAAASRALSAKASAWFQATMVTASIPEVVAAATVAR